MEKEMQLEKQGSSININVQHGCRYLPDDIMREILSRLSVKSLLRYMSVSKNWKFLISNNSFKKLHHQRSLNNNPPSMLVLHCSRHDNNPVLTTFDLAGEVVQQWTLPRSNNLEMMTFPSQSKLVCFTDRLKFFLCNPSTRQLINLPCPSSYTYFGGFGYVPSRDEYVIVHNTKFGFEILTLSISNDDEQLHYNAWRPIEAMDIRPVYRPWGVFVCGAFYWMLKDKEDGILSFDTENEIFSTFGLPLDFQDSNGVYMSPLEIKGELYFMSIRLSWQHNLKLWKLSDVKNRIWTQCLRIFAPIFHHNLNSLKVNGEVLMCMLKLNEPYENFLRHHMELKIENKLIIPWGMGIHTNLFSL